MTEHDDELAQVGVIGMAGRFPGAADVAGLWDLLADGREALTRTSREDLAAQGVDPALLDHPDFVPVKGVLPGADTFDAELFGFSPREAELMDPQHRVFLECVWEALESAGLDPARFAGRIGLFAGASLNTYLLRNLSTSPAVLRGAGEYQTQLANDKDFLATRAAYLLGLRGPAMTVQTACSTSLVAVHLAVQSLLSGECDVALAGGVSVNVPLRNGYLHERGGILSPDGRCRPFAADAAGTVIGNGVGVVVLRRLDQARAHGDRVDAVVLGSAVNNDGGLKAGFTAPGVEGQAEVVAEALAVADVPARSVGYVEAHGTGTPLGDPIEVAALTRAYRETTQDTGFCLLGSVKGNLGHLDAAAGVTGLIKAVLALRHEAVPPTLHAEHPNPRLGLDASPFVLASDLTPWPRGAEPRRAGVSSFGIGGTNAHVVLEEPPAPAPVEPGRPWQLVTVTARDAGATARAAARLADDLDAHPARDLADVAVTQGRRRTFEHRRAVVALDTADAARRLRGTGADADAHAVRVAFLFPGQGSQHVGMARALHRDVPVFRDELDRCLELLAPHTDDDLRGLLLGDGPDDAGLLVRTRNAQPALFAVEHALARTLAAWGVVPSALAGHSVGEYVAACLGGVMTLPDAAALVAARGRLTEQTPTGAMLAVLRPEDETRALLGDGLELAAVNGPAACVVAGGHAEVDDLERRLRAAGVECRRLHTSHAFHSRLVAPAAGPLVELVRAVPLAAPTTPVCSNVTGTWLTAAEATDPEYWGRHLRAPVRFADDLATLLADDGVALVEVGPGQTLTSLARTHPAWGPRRVGVRTMPRPGEDAPARRVLLEATAALWQAGVDLDRAAPAGPARRVLELPTYPFRRERYWVSPGERSDAPPATAAGRTPAADPESWTTVPAWRASTSAAGGPASGTWCVLGADLPAGARLAERLTADGARVVRVVGDPRANGEHVDPTSGADLSRVLAPLADRPVRVVHAWTLVEPGAGSDAERLDAGLERGFASLLALLQAVDRLPAGREVAVDVVTTGVFDVTGEETLLPEHATLLGPCTVGPREVPGLVCRLLDVDTAARDDDALVTALLRRDPDAVAALRGDAVWARTFDRVRLTRPLPRARLRDGGTYLVTGGTGGVGLAVAEHLAGAVHAPVLGLLGRRELPPRDAWDAWLATHPAGDPTSEVLRRMRAIEDRGARVVPLRADVTDLDQTAAAVAGLRAVGGPLAGVVHAAGVPGGGLLTTRRREDWAAVLAAKTRGTVVLEEVCAADPLDLVLLCSSRTAVLGEPGQVDYCAANAYLDAFATRSARDTGRLVTSIGWDTWRGTGMARVTGHGADAPPEVVAEPGHPLLQRQLAAEPGSWSYATTLSTAQSWVVDEHRMMGHGLVPGTTYLEMVRAAVAPLAEGREIELRDVLFSEPVIVPDGQERELVVRLADDDAGLTFTVRTRAPGAPGRWREHATGTVVLHDRAARPRRDVGDLLRECAADEAVVGEEQIRRRLHLDLADGAGLVRFQISGRWRCLDRVDVGPHGLVAHLTLPDAYAADLATYLLHPALLDVVGGASRVHAAEGYYLPFVYGSLRVVHGLTARMVCHLRVREGAGSTGETLTCDADVYDDTGRLLVELRGFVMKRVPDPVELRDQVDRAAAGPGVDEAPASAPATGGTDEQEAVALLGRLLRARDLPPHVVVSTVDLDRARRELDALDPAALLASLAGGPAPGATSGGHPRPDLDTPYAAPATPTQVQVAQVWQDVLGLDRVGVDDDFFALGGHSLAAVRVAARLRELTGADLALHEFFERPTVARTAELLTARPADPAVPQDEVVPLPRASEADLDALTDEEVDAMLRELAAAEQDGGAEA